VEEQPGAVHDDEVEGDGAALGPDEALVRGVVVPEEHALARVVRVVEDGPGGERAFFFRGTTESEGDAAEAHVYWSQVASGFMDVRSTGKPDVMKPWMKTPMAMMKAALRLRVMATESIKIWEKRRLRPLQIAPK